VFDVRSPPPNFGPHFFQKSHCHLSSHLENPLEMLLFGLSEVSHWNLSFPPPRWLFDSFPLPLFLPFPLTVSLLFHLGGIDSSLRTPPVYERIYAYSTSLIVPFPSLLSPDGAGQWKENTPRVRVCLSSFSQNPQILTEPLSPSPLFPNLAPWTVFVPFFLPSPIFVFFRS